MEPLELEFCKYALFVALNVIVLIVVVPNVIAPIAVVLNVVVPLAILLQRNGMANAKCL